MNCKTSNFPSTDYHYYIYKRELRETEREGERYAEKKSKP